MVRERDRIGVLMNKKIEIGCPTKKNRKMEKFEKRKSSFSSVARRLRGARGTEDTESKVFILALSILVLAVPKSSPPNITLL